MSAHGIGHLLRTRRFVPLCIAQFLGAFNDNMFKNALVIWATFGAAAAQGYNPALLVTLAAALFILPFFLFSATAGSLADAYEKAWLIRRIKIAEIVLMAIGAAGFIAGHVTFLLTALFMLGAQAAFFGPVKYAILPDQLKPEELVAGNALVEGSTFLAILLGTIAGGVLIALPNGTYLVSGLGITIALLGYSAARFVPDSVAPSPGLRLSWNVAGDTWRMLRYATHHPTVLHAVLGISWFWLVGATFLAQFPTYVKQVLNGDEHIVTLFLAVFSIGIGLGSLLCNRVLRGKLQTRYVPFGALGISLFALDFCWGNFPSGTAGILTLREFLAIPAYWRTMFDLLMIAVSGGFYIVPLYVQMQAKSAPEHRARVIASNNVFNALFMVASAALTYALLLLHSSVVIVFLTVAALNALALPLMIRWFARKAA